LLQLIKSVEQSIPTPLKQAISLGDKYDTYVETCIRDTIKKRKSKGVIGNVGIAINQNP